MTSNRNPKPILLVFGPQALNIDAAAVSRIRDAAVSSGHGWLLDDVSNLPTDYTTAISQLPVLRGKQRTHDEPDVGLTQLRQLSTAIKTGQPLTESTSLSFPLPNKVLIPLVVVAQLTQYEEFLTRTCMMHAPEPSEVCHRAFQTLGCCTGLLGAFVASCSKNETQFRIYSAVAVRLGMLIGAVLDAFETGSESNTGAISASWNADETDGIATLKRILKDFPEASSVFQYVSNCVGNTYISNYHDFNRATVTGPLAILSSLKQRLRSDCGISSIEIKGLQGRYHSRHNAGILESLIQFCEEHPEFQLPDASSCHIPTRSNRDGGRLIKKGSLHRHLLGSILVDPMEWFDTFKRVRSEFMSDTIIPDGQIVVFGFERSIPPSMTHCLAPHMNYNYMKIASGSAYHGKNESGGPRASENSVSDRAPPKDGHEYSKNDIAIVGMSIKVAGANDLESFWDVLCSGNSQHKEVPNERFRFEESVFRDAADPSRKWFANLIDGPAEFDHHFFKKSPRESAAMDPQQRHMLQIAYQAVEMSGYFSQVSSRSAAVPALEAARPEEKRRVGCFIGCSTCDYEQNVACHNTSAFTATGQLRAFLAGKVSHFFGWTGPSVTVDTACSSSAVAVHQACQAILAGECGAALAGGSFVMAGPQWFEDLSAASFLSPTGQCKPFDADADGYCRGDGVAAVFLKRLDDAVADGDEVLGVIGATAVQQNENCTSIFVPNEPSLSDLFETVLGKAGLQPGDITVMESHGTGTAVGDPAEYGAVRRVLGGYKRSKVTACRASGKQETKPLYLGSVKGSVGHTECTAGVVSLIKVALMLNKGIIPPQASFNRINKSINPQPDDNIVINTGSVKPWDADFKAALVSSYGASGSNACIVLKQAPRKDASHGAEYSYDGCEYPFWLSANNDQGLHRNIHALRKFVCDCDIESHGKRRVTLRNISISLSRQRSRLLDRALIFKAKSLDDLEKRLGDYENGLGSDMISVSRPSSKPVILCFGGQISTTIGLDRTVFEGTGILQYYLNEVDVIARSHIPGGILPSVFDKSPQQDPVKLQVALFALQYASARSWMDCGIKPVAVIGHSFGEISAMCVSGVLSLRDAVSLVVSRATLVRDAWGADKGAMIAIEADLSDAQRLVAGSGGRAAIACYNGPRSFTLGGSTAAIVEMEKKIAAGSRPIKSKRLNVSNAFHCPLVDPLVDGLEKCARNLKFYEPKIHIEQAIEFPSSGDHLLGPNFVARHMRDPVFFHHAIVRLAGKYQQSGAIFLEAGSSSTITNMASRALGDSSSPFSFHAVNITSPSAARPEDGSMSSTRSWNSLVDATLKLWAAGAVGLQYWAHHHAQPRPEGAPLFLPPYQFEPARHWLDRIQPSEKLQALRTNGIGEVSQKKHNLVSFNGMVSIAASLSSREHAGLGTDGRRGTEDEDVLFRVVSESPLYKRLVNGHKMAYTAGICPAPVQVDLVIEALCLTLPGRTRSLGQQGSSTLLSTLGLHPQISDVVCYVPLTDNPARMVWIEMSGLSHACTLLEAVHNSTQHCGEHGNGSRSDINSFAEKGFTFELFSTDTIDERDWGSLSRESLSRSKKMKHTTGTVRLVKHEDASTAREFSQLSRFVHHSQVTQLLQDAGADNVLSHKGVYFMFESIVEYCGDYRGIQRLVSHGNQTAAIVGRPDGQHQLRPRPPGQQEDYLGGQTDDDSWLQPCVADTFAQTSGMWLNCLAPDTGSEQMFVFNGFERWLRRPPEQSGTNDSGPDCHAKQPARPAEMHVLATQHRKSDMTAVSDVFVFDAATGKLFEAVLGMGWVRTPRHHMQETLARLSGSGTKLEHRFSRQIPTVEAVAAAGNTVRRSLRSSRSVEDEQRVEKPQAASTMPTAITTKASAGVCAKTKELLAELLGLSINNIADNSELASLGIDSLMNMELASEIRSTFKIAISESELMQIVYVSDLVEYIEKVVGSGMIEMTKATTRTPAASEIHTPSSSETTEDQTSSRKTSLGSLMSSHDEYSQSEYGTLSPTSPSLASRDEDKYEPWLKGVPQSPEQLAARKTAVDDYVRTLTDGWSTPFGNFNIPHNFTTSNSTGNRCEVVVAVTGGTGGLGAHLVAQLTADPTVCRVVCLNRRNPRSHQGPLARQLDAVLSKTGLDLSQPQHAAAAAKLRVLEADLSQPKLGLDADDYASLVAGLTHVVHSAWTMSLAHGLAHFEPQMRIMRRLLDLTRDAALLPLTGDHHHEGGAARPVTFQFVSSIAVVGHHPLLTGAPAVPEERVGVGSVLPAGYADAKWACELMLDGTLHRWPGLFRPMAVRLGQIAASRSGYWNTAEHVSFIIRSSQTLGALPAFDGTLGWTPVDDVAGSLVDLLFVCDGGRGELASCQMSPYPIYNIDNPLRTPWGETMVVLADALGLDPHDAIVPLNEWVQRVRKYGSRPGNPAHLLIDFLEANFERISCGGLLLETRRAQEHSSTMRDLEPFSNDMTRLFVQKWKDSGFLGY